MVTPSMRRTVHLERPNGIETVRLCIATAAHEPRSQGCGELMAPTAKSPTKPRRSGMYHSLPFGAAAQESRTTVEPFRPAPSQLGPHETFAVELPPTLSPLLLRDSAPPSRLCEGQTVAGMFSRVLQGWVGPRRAGRAKAGLGGSEASWVV